MRKILFVILFLTTGMHASDQKLNDTLYYLELQEVMEICREAGRKILAIRSSGQLKSTDVLLSNGKIVRQTNADIEVCKYILDEFAKKTPDYGVISQDNMDQDPNWYLKEWVWLINPIDGTREFEHGKDDFHIQIGLLDREEAVLGVSYYPATDTFIWAIKNHGAWLERKARKQRLRAAPSRKQVLILSSSRKILKPYFQKWGWIPDETISETASSSSRLLKIIQGEASLYISLGASPLGKEKKGGIWNYGANCVIAKEAGVSLSTLNGNPVNLRESSGLLVEGIVITNDPVAYAAVTQSDLLTGAIK